MEPTTKAPPKTHYRPAPRRRKARLTFAPTAWLKLMWFCHFGDTEVGGFGLSDPSSPLYVLDFLTLPQETSWAHVKFPDEALADFFEDNVDRGYKPDQFARIWLHTHPGSSAQPSGTDEDTFHNAFGRCDWSVMGIVSRTGNTYARLHFAAGPGSSVLIPVRVDWSRWGRDGMPDWEYLAHIWHQDYEAHVHSTDVFQGLGASALNDPAQPGMLSSVDDFDKDWLAKLDSGEEAEWQKWR